MPNKNFLKVVSGISIVIVSLLFQNCSSALDFKSLSSESPSTGDSLVSQTLAWDPTTRDISGQPISISGYRIYYGTTSGIYPYTVNESVVGPNTSYTLRLERGRTYFFSVSAFSTANGQQMESDRSEELTLDVY